MVSVPNRLVIDANLDDPDRVYERLLAAHEGLNDEESARLNARLVLILMNHVGDSDVLEQAFKLARTTTEREG